MDYDILRSSKTQLGQLVELEQSQFSALYEPLNGLSLSLVMGMEQYLKRFNSALGIPLLIRIVDKASSKMELGDIVVMALRSLSLIMEHVPASSLIAADNHTQICRLTSSAMHQALCGKWRYQQTDTTMMVEECLRVIRFTAKDDLTGTTLEHIAVGDLLTLCAYEDNLISRQALEALVVLCSKVVLPSQLEPAQMSLNIFALIKQKLTDGSSKRGPPDAYSCDHPLVLATENVIAPFLLNLIENLICSYKSVPDLWYQLELAVTCLGRLIERSLLCHRPRTCRAMVSSELPLALFHLMNYINSQSSLDLSVREERVLLCETLLGLITCCHRTLMLNTLMSDDAQRFFVRVLETSSSGCAPTDESNRGAEEAISTARLDDPFPRAPAIGSSRSREKGDLTTIAAFRLFVMACPTVPVEAFGLQAKVVLSVHQWLWEDDMHHYNRVIEEQCVDLESTLSQLAKEATVMAQGKKATVNFHSMSLGRGQHTKQRNVSRRFVPFVFHLTDEAKLRPVVSGVSEAAVSSSTSAGGGSADKDKSTRGASASSRASGSGGMILNSSAEVEPQHVAVGEVYLEFLCRQVKSAQSLLTRQIAISACASVLQMLLLAPKSSQRVEKLLRKVMLPMCEMFRVSLIIFDCATKSVVLTMMKWMLFHPVANSWDFALHAYRSGLVHQLQVLSTASSLPESSSRSAANREHLAEEARRLHKDLQARLQRELKGAKQTSMEHFSPVYRDIKRCLQDLSEVDQSQKGKGSLSDNAGIISSTLRKLLTIFSGKFDLTPYEAYELRLAPVLLSFLLGGRQLGDVLGETTKFVSSGSGCTYSPEMVSSLFSPSSPVEERSPWHFSLNRRDQLKMLLLHHATSSRVALLIRVANELPSGLHSLITTLVSTLPLDAELPLVESLVTRTKVKCRPAKEAFQLIGDLAPTVSLCCVDERGGTPRLSMSPSTYHSEESSTARRSSKLERSSAAPRSSTNRGGSAFSARAMAMQRICPLTTDVGSPRDPQSPASPIPTTPPITAPPSVSPKDYCIRGHKLQHMSSSTRTYHCSTCKKGNHNSHACSTCSIHICEDCYTSYEGNPLISALMTGSTLVNRTHLFAQVGDIERFFRTGTSSTKGTQVAPAPHSQLAFFEIFMSRATTFLMRTMHEPKTEAVARKLLQDHGLLHRKLFDVLKKNYSKSSLLASSSAAALANNTANAATSTTLAAEEDRLANELLAEAVEERYVLYRPNTGRCNLSQTFVGLLFERAFIMGNKQVMLQLENCLLVSDENPSEPLTIPNTSSSVRPSKTRASASATGGTHADQSQDPSSSSVSSPRPFFSREFDHDSIHRGQRYQFHHFIDDESSRCACGHYSRTNFNCSRPSEIAHSLPPMAYRGDFLLLVMFFEIFCSKGKGEHLTREELPMTTSDVKESAFLSSAVTASVLRSLEASALKVSLLPLPYAVPRWVQLVLDQARFLLPRAVRERISRFAAYDARRALYGHLRSIRAYRFDRTTNILPSEGSRYSNHKFIVDRTRLLQDAYKVLRKGSDARYSLSIEFKGDVGVGQGPTAQFYSLLAKEVSRVGMRLWKTADTAAKSTAANRSNGDAFPLVVPPKEGLYPLPVGKQLQASLLPSTPHDHLASCNSSFTKTLTAGVADSYQTTLRERFYCIQDYVMKQREHSQALYAVGAALGRAFVDSQVFPLALSPAVAIFLRQGLPPHQLVLDVSQSSLDAEAEMPIDVFGLSVGSLKWIDTEVARSVASLRNMDDKTLRMLDLRFTLPGNESYELVAGGSDVVVTIHNLERYQRRVVAALIYESVAQPLRLLTMGCLDVVPHEALAVMEVEELLPLLCGEANDDGAPLWTEADLQSVLVADHGYQQDSPQIKMLASVLCRRLTIPEQRAFLFFCTGCPRLPLGGIKALGAITVVRRSHVFIAASPTNRETAEEEVHDSENDEHDEEEEDDERSGAGAAAPSAGSPRQPGTSDWSGANLATGVPISSIVSGTTEDPDPTHTRDADWALPSVNTCFRYLKLPPYPSEDLMWRKLKVAIMQSGDTFELS